MGFITLGRFPLLLPGSVYGVTTTLIIDAVGESQFTLGRLRMAAGSGTKTLSAAGGGKIYMEASSSNVFSNAGTTLRLGVQDVASGLEDGTFDVYADLVGGTDVINSSKFNQYSLTSGSKSLTHGDVVAIGAEMISRGGTDAVRLVQSNDITGGSFEYPYRSSDTGSGPGPQLNTVVFAVRFDDGTYGWIEGASPTSVAPTVTGDFNLNSTPDEYLAAFTPTVPFKTSGAIVHVSAMASGEDAEIILYSDPFGTPAAQRTITHATPNRASNGSRIVVSWSSFTHAVGTAYGIALRATTTGNIRMGYFDLTDGGLKVACPFGTSTKLASRTDQSGAFSEVDAAFLANVTLLVDALDDGTGGGSGGGLRLAGHGGLVA